MKNFLLSVLVFLLSVGLHAQNEVTVKAGTAVPLQVVNYTRASQVKVGDNVLFRVSRDVLVNGINAIPYGTTVRGTVYEAKKSSWWGTKGRLGIRVNEIAMPNGDIIPLENGNLYVTGKNRTTLSVLLFCFVTIPACFITGERAEVQAGYEIQAYVAKTTTIHPQ